MYHPNKYEEHNRAQRDFIDKFNSFAMNMGNEVSMYFQEVENFRDDGGIVFSLSGEKVLYDFEKRHTYYNSCEKFSFPSLGQFERKIKKEEIKLSIQVSSDECCFVIAWHDDYQKEERKNINSATEDGNKEDNPKRFTKDFVEIPYNRMDIFYRILINAFKKQEFNKKSFLIDLPITSPRGKYTYTPIHKVDLEDLEVLVDKKCSPYKIDALYEIKRREIF